MKPLLLLLALVPLGGGFGEATATVSPQGDQMEVELVVEVNASAASVVVHIVVGGDTAIEPIALDQRSAGLFGGFVTLPVQDAVVVFERVAVSGGELSQPVTLAALGADFSQFATAVEFVDPADDSPDDNSGWLWLAVAAGAAALSALAFWVFLGTDQESEEGSADSETSAEVPPPESD